MDETAFRDKVQRLNDIIGGMGSVLIAYSGGVDSTLLADVARELLGNDTLAVFGSSPVMTAEEQEDAEALARKLGLRFMTIQRGEMDNPLFTANPPERCYYCKQDIFGQLKEIAAAEGLDWIADGTNADDTDDYRPGRKAGTEAGIRSPLLEAGMTKDDIRRLSRERGLSTWDRPASPCLATRIPSGTPVTTALLATIALGEGYLHDLGLGQIRLRHHGDTARIEMDPDDMAKVMVPDIRRGIVGFLTALGYRYVTLDMAGYRTGSLNKVPETTREDIP